MGEVTVQALKRLHKELKKRPYAFTRAQKEAAITLLEEIHRLIGNAKSHH